ncbi:MAG: hypothetical protein CMO81_00525 [Waddliaceae bacterium]|nr:hypothetical protein [Waddliaceae bacterium]
MAFSNVSSFSHPVDVYSGFSFLVDRLSVFISETGEITSIFPEFLEHANLSGQQQNEELCNLLGHLFSYDNVIDANGQQFIGKIVSLVFNQMQTPKLYHIPSSLSNPHVDSRCLRQYVEKEILNSNEEERLSLAESACMYLWEDTKEIEDLDYRTACAVSAHAVIELATEYFELCSAETFPIYTSIQNPGHLKTVVNSHQAALIHLQLESLDLKHHEFPDVKIDFPGHELVVIKGEDPNSGRIYQSYIAHYSLKNWVQEHPLNCGRRRWKALFRIIDAFWEGKIITRQTANDLRFVTDICHNEYIGFKVPEKRQVLAFAMYMKRD